MLSLSTDADCTVFDRFEVRVSRGGDAVFQQTWMRADCPVMGISPPPPAPLRRDGPAFDLAIVDSQRIDARVRVDVAARTVNGLVFTTAAETDFVDGVVYRVPLELAQACAASAMTLACPSGFVCRIDRSTGMPACGSVYRAPNTVGTFMSSQPIVAHTTIDLDATE